MGKIIENYSLQVELGSGVYSRVYKAINLKTKEQVAIKMVKADKFKQLPKLEQGTINQINILSNLQHCPYIIRYYDMLKTVNNFYFVYQFCNGGTLQQLLKKNGALTQHDTLGYLYQIVEAFKILARHNIMHRDLKPENILLHNGIIKIADFGFCKLLENSQQMAQTMLGSPLYMAPQILKGDHYTIKADIWSLGVVLFRMLFGYCPYQSTNIAKLIMMLDNQELKIPQDFKISPILTQLIKRMLTKDPKYRADWQQIFAYQISSNGIRKYQSEDVQKYMRQSQLKASTTISNSSIYPKHSIDTNISKNYGYSNKDIKLKKQNSLEKIYQISDKFQQSNHYLSSKTQSRDRSKSPFGDRNLRIQFYVKNHFKCLDLNSLILELFRYSEESSLFLCYILAKGVERELLGIMQSSKKDKCTNQSILLIRSFLEEQTLSIKNNLDLIEERIPQCLNYQKIEQNKIYYLKYFLSTLKSDSKQQLILGSRLVDYLNDNIFIKKQTYQKLGKQQLQRKLKTIIIN